MFCKRYCVSRKVRFESLNFFALRNMARSFALVRNGTYLVKGEAVTNHWDGAIVWYRKAGDSFSWLKVISVALTEEEASPEGAVKSRSPEFGYLRQGDLCNVLACHCVEMEHFLEVHFLTLNGYYVRMRFNIRRERKCELSSCTEMLDCFQVENGAEYCPFVPYCCFVDWWLWSRLNSGKHMVDLSFLVSCIYCHFSSAVNEARKTLPLTWFPWFFFLFWTPSIIGLIEQAKEFGKLYTAFRNVAAYKVLMQL